MPVLSLSKCTQIYTDKKEKRKKSVFFCVNLCPQEKRRNLCSSVLICVPKKKEEICVRLC